MPEKPFKLIKGEATEISSIEKAQGYVDCLISIHRLKGFPIQIIEKSINNDFVLKTRLENTGSQMSFAENGILIAVFAISFLDDFEDNVLDHERYELRQIKGEVDLYKRVITDDKVMHEPCSVNEKELLAEVINILDEQKLIKK